MLRTDQMIVTAQQQADTIMQHCNLVLECCERLTEEGMRSTRELLAQAESDVDALLRGETIGFINAAGRIGLDSWALMTACIIRFQREAVGKSFTFK